MIDEKRLAQMMADQYNEYWNRGDIFEAIETQMAMRVMLTIHNMIDSLAKADVTDTNVGCKWIPCSERLPDESGKYLVQCRNRANANIYFEVAHVNVWSDGKKTCLVDGEPMAWQDLPEPYREGDV